MKTLLKNFTIVTMNENLDVLKDAHLIVEDGKITEVAAGAATGDFDEVIDGQNKQVLMPRQKILWNVSVGYFLNAMRM